MRLANSFTKHANNPAKAKFLGIDSQIPFMFYGLQNIE